MLSAVAFQQAHKQPLMQRTNSQHFDVEPLQLADPSLRFRNPHHASIDQNSVDLQVEQSTYAENSVQFQASFTLLNNKFKGLMTALRGD